MSKVINIYNLLNKKSVYSREDIISLKSLLCNKKDLTLDFIGIEFFSPSAAHELLKILKEEDFKLINLNESLKLLLETQNKLRSTNVDLSTFFELKICKGLEL